MFEIPEIIDVEALVNTHWHGREGEVVGPLVEMAIAGGADVLGPQPNTENGLTTATQVVDYIGMAKGLVPRGKTVHFIPFVMITEKTTEKDIDDCVNAGILDGKIYPKDRTTKSHNGVEHYGRILPQIKHCGKVGMKVHPHPEHPLMLFSNHDAEFAFLPIVYMWLEETDAVIVWEHGTDVRCIPHWKYMAKTWKGRFFVTLTAHHLATNEDSVYGENDAVCKPIIKGESSRQGLVDLVGEDYNWVMAGLDDAFHPKGAKYPESGRCACGSYTGPLGLPLYAHSLEHLFKTSDGIRTFVNFTSRNPRKLHKLPPSSRTIKLVRESWKIPPTYPIGHETALPFWAGQMLNYKIAG